MLLDFWNFIGYFYQNKLTQILKDTAKHQGLRNQLVKLLGEKKITDSTVLEAIKKVPRHLFFNSSFADYAYQDKAFPIAAGQTISQPYTVAFQSQLLEVKKGHKILEIGTGSGYQTAVLCTMGAIVYSQIHWQLSPHFLDFHHRNQLIHIYQIVVIIANVFYRDGPHLKRLLLT